MLRFLLATAKDLAVLAVTIALAGMLPFATTGQALRGPRRTIRHDGGHDRL
jgi:hypothetical protein